VGGEVLMRLLDAYRNYLRLLARTSLHGSKGAGADPSDLAQETLLRAHQRFGQFRGSTEGELAAWLRRILCRVLADSVRRRTGRGGHLPHEKSLDAQVDSSSFALHKLIPSKGTSPSLAAQRRELGVLVADALAELSPDHREVIVLRHFEERDWKEVGRRMGRSADAVRMLWARALERLRPVIKASP
jgi:RNA polymerase sigma-70 factor (ECF subfamily)